MQQGILSGGNPQQPMPGQNQAPQNADAEGTQEQYDVVAGQMLNFLYSDQGLEAFQANVSGQDPVNQIAKFIGRLMTTSAQSATFAGKLIPPKVLFQAGMELSKAISELAQKQGILTPENEASVIQDAFYNGIALFANEAGEEALRPQEREQYIALLKMVEQKQQAGVKPPVDQPQQEVPA